MKKGMLSGVVAASVVFSGVLYGEEAATQTTARVNRVGVNITFVEDEDTAYGVIYERDLTPRDRLFLQVETFDFENSEETVTPDYISTWKSESEGEEIELGYLRRVSQPADAFGFFIGPSIAVQFDEGTFESTESDIYGTDVARGDIDMDPGININANVMADYTFKSNVGLFGMFSYGYQFERDGKMKYSTGSRPTRDITSDSDTFWNFALGVTYSF